jgi:hypothetical protein
LFSLIEDVLIFYLALSNSITPIIELLLPSLFFTGEISFVTSFWSEGNFTFKVEIDLARFTDAFRADYCSCDE